MNILYDHQAFDQIIGGISRSFVGLISNLDASINYQVSLRYSRNYYVKQILPGISYPFDKIYLPYKRRIIRKINTNFSINQIKKSNYDLFHPTFEDPYFLKYIFKPLVVTVHDLIPETYPYLWSKGWILNRKLIYSKADHLVAVSQNTKNELLHYYPWIEPNKVSVIYHGFCNSIIVNHTMKLDFKYILYVGGRKAYKNFKLFVEACAPLLQKASDIFLVCAGNSFDHEEIELFRLLEIEKKVYHMQPTDNELYELYQRAVLFVFPSLKEGFGLPILEAWGNNCPVVLSKVEPFIEIAGDAAFYFDPLSKKDIRECIEKTIFDSKRRETIVRKGYDRLKQFNWKKTAESYGNIYSVVLNR